MRDTTKRGRGALAAGALIVVSASGCVRSQPINPGGPVSSNYSGTSSATGSSSTDSAKPGCSDAVQALQDEGQKIAGMLNQPQSVMSVAYDLAARLKDAANKATDPTVRSAIQAVADDLGALATAAGNNDTNGIQDAAAKDATDAATLFSACAG